MDKKMKSLEEDLGGKYNSIKKGCELYEEGRKQDNNYLEEARKCPCPPVVNVMTFSPILS